MTFQHIRSRRDFLRLGCRSAATVGAVAALSKAGLINALAQTSTDYKAIVCIFLYGGNDANNLLIPNDATGYANYSKIRQNLAIPQSSLISITDPATSGVYGLHPAFSSIAPLYNTSKRLALVANVGTLVQPVPRSASGLPQLSAVPLPLNLYSHSDQQNEWQDAISAGGGTTGWGGRLADKVAAVAGGSLPPSVSMSGNVLQLVGQSTQQSTINTSNFALVAPATDPGTTALQQILGLSSGATLVQAAQKSMKDAISMATAVNSALTGAANLGVTFPTSDIGTQLGQVAKLLQVKGSFGATRQIFFCSQGGYDTHTNQLAQQTSLYGNLAAALNAFDLALTALNLQTSVTTFTESDFGRTFQPNGDAGTDHGWGSHALVMGGAVSGGKIYGKFPTQTLAGPDDSGSRGTWVPSTSHDQYVGAVAKWFGLAQADLDYVFPNLKTFSYQTLGVV